MHLEIRIRVFITEESHGPLSAGPSLCAAPTNKIAGFHGDRAPDTRVGHRREHGDLQPARSGNVAQLAGSGP